VNARAPLAQAPVAAPSHRALLDRLGLAAAAPWVVDLTLGAWRPRAAAHQLAAQAGVALAPPGVAPVFSAQAGAGTDWAAMVGTNIDAEARGPTQVLNADADAEALLPHLCADGPPIVIAWLPLAAGLPDDNGWFLRILGRRIAAGRGTLVLARREGGDAGDAGAICLRPELLPADLAGDRAPGDYPLRGGQVLCCPARRPPAWPPAARAPFDRLCADRTAPPWLRAFAACHGSNYFVDVDVLTAYAAFCFGQGSGALALRYMGRARDCARDPTRRAAVVAGMQGMRIAGQEFAEAAAEPPPAANVPAPLRDFLHQAIGWSRILQGRTDGFADYFGALGTCQPDSGDQLYAMNIYALGLARSGRVDEALATELRIEEARRTLAPGDARLAYVNNLNIARLYKGRGQLADADRYYGQAFATNYGVRSHAEAAHAAWIRCSMLRATGDTAAAHVWLVRAALHWLADPVPDAVPVRLAQAVLGMPLPAPEDRAEAMSATLLRRLADAVEHGGLACAAPGAAGTTPVFVPIGAGSAAWPQRYHGWPGCAVGWSGAHGALALARPPHDDAQAALAALTARVLAGCAHVPPGGAVIVDDQDGRDLPGTWTGVLALALARGAATCGWQGDSVALDGATGDALRAALVLRRSPALASLDPAGAGAWHFRYLRHGRTCRLGDAAAALVACVERDGPLRAAAPGVTRTAWTGAWRSGAIDLQLPEEACIQAGIRWPTNGTCNPDATH